MTYRPRARRSNPRPEIPAAPLTAFGLTFASRPELRRYLFNRARQDAGEISGLRKGPKLCIQDAWTDEHGRKHAARHYTPDLAYEEAATGVTVMEEVKPMSPKAPSRTRRDWQLRMDAAQLRYGAYRFDVVYC